MAWPTLMRDLAQVQAVTVDCDGQRYRLRTDLAGSARHAFAAAGGCPPPSCARTPATAAPIDGTHPAQQHLGSTTNTEKYLKAAERLKDVTILRQDYRKTLKAFDSPDTFFFIDAPYPGEWFDKHKIIQLVEFIDAGPESSQPLETLPHAAETRYSRCAGRLGQAPLSLHAEAENRSERPGRCPSTRRGQREPTLPCNEGARLLLPMDNGGQNEHANAHSDDRARCLPAPSTLPASPRDH